MKSIHDESTCRSAGIWAGKLTKNFHVQSGTYGDRKPKGCSWHNSGNVELWKSSSGDCGVGYHGCFCIKTQGKIFPTASYSTNFTIIILSLLSEFYIINFD